MSKQHWISKIIHAFNQTHEDGNAELVLDTNTNPARNEHKYTCSQGLTECMEASNLFTAWEKVLANKGACGTDGVTVEQYSKNVLGRLQQLRSLVLAGNYAPSPLKQNWIEKPNGGQRKLSIPSVQDRIVQTAVAQYLSPQFEEEFENASYGYRPGRSVAMAVARVCRYRDQGNLWVLEADIDGFFDNLNHKRLFELAHKYIKDRSIERLIKTWIQIPVKSKNGLFLLEKGIPQGSPLSPLLANLYLNELDEKLLAQNFNLVRFADDFVVLCKSRTKAEEAQRAVTQILADIRLQLNTRKTRVTNFQNQFVFLGVRFAGNLINAVRDGAEPWVIPEDHEYKQASQHEIAEALSALQKGNNNRTYEVDAPCITQAVLPYEAAGQDDNKPSYDEIDTLAVHELENGTIQAETIRELNTPGLQGLYVASHGHAIKLNTDRVEVWVQKEKKQSVPIGQLDHILISGRGMVSTSFLNACHEKNISCLIAPDGEPVTSFGSLSDYPSASFISQLAKMRDPAFKLMMARSVVKAKLHNCKVVLRRFARRDDQDLSARVETISSCISKLDSTTSVGEVLGLEGAAANAYFKAFKALLPPEYNFPGRRRRPPRDPVNVLLSYGYTVLHAKMNHMVIGAGLNPHIGQLHTEGPNTYALVNDLVEEFRALVVDSVVLTLCRANKIGNTDFKWFTDSDTPCFLDAAGRKVFLSALETKFKSNLVHPGEKKIMDHYTLMRHQIQHYMRVLLREEFLYKGFQSK